MNSPILDTSKSDAVRQRMENANPSHVALFHRTAKLREMVESLRAQIMFSMMATPGGGADIWHLDNQGNHVFVTMTSPDVARYGTMRAVLEMIEASDEYKAAVAEIEPILSDLAAAETEELQLRREFDAAQATLKAAEEAALAKAKEKAAADPAVTKAKSALEAAAARYAGAS